MSAKCLILGIQGPELTPEETRLFQEIQPAGYILFSRNLIEPKQIRALTDSLRALSYDPPFISIDQEGGRVWRTREIGSAPPEAAIFAKQAKPHEISEFGAQTGRLLELLGINFNFAPVLDLDHHPEENNGLRGRCWGRDSQNVIDKAGLFNRWMRKNGVMGCGKHFPTNGLALSDPHHELPVADISKEDLLKEDLLPYTALMPELDGIMACHLNFPQLDPEYPASLSKKILTNLLRTQLDYRGLILTDDLDMGAIVNHYGRGPDVKLAIEAGADLALICHQTETIPEALAALKEVSQGTIIDIIERVEKVQRKLKGPPEYSNDRWSQINDKLTELTQKLIGSERFEVERQVQSPVEEY